MKNILLSAVFMFVSSFTIQGHTNEQKSSTKSSIDLSPNKPVHKLFPLTIISINGKSVNHRNDMIMLEPGEYHLTFLANVNTSFYAKGDRILRTKINQRKYQDSLDLVVDEGKSYQLGFDASATDVADWKPVLLKTTVRK